MMTVRNPLLDSSAARYMPAGPAPTTATSYRLEGVAGVRVEAKLCCALSLLLACMSAGWNVDQACAQQGNTHSCPWAAAHWSSCHRVAAIASQLQMLTGWSWRATYAQEGCCVGSMPTLSHTGSTYASLARQYTPVLALMCPGRTLPPPLVSRPAGIAAVLQRMSRGGGQMAST
eukprot:1094889-Pelagomonas_calceolata.AAC.1